MKGSLDSVKSRTRSGASAPRRNGGRGSQPLRTFSSEVFGPAVADRWDREDRANAE